MKIETLKALADFVNDIASRADFGGDRATAGQLLTCLVHEIELCIEANICRKCEGCGKIASDDEQTPWSRWLKLPLESSIAVVAGLVTPLECPECEGTGRV
jgi:hypothetical protein